MPRKNNKHHYTPGNLQDGMVDYKNKILPYLERSGFIPLYLLLRVFNTKNLWPRKRLTFREVDKAYEEVYKARINRKTWQDDIVQVLVSLDADSRKSLNATIESKIGALNYENSRDYTIAQPASWRTGFESAGRTPIASTCSFKGRDPKDRLASDD